MVRISPDVGRNRVVIKLAGAPTSADSATGEGELREALSRLRAPVDVLSDIRELQGLEPSLTGDFQRLGEILRAFGVRKVVRLVGKCPQAAVHMERLSRQLKGHTAHLAFSMVEADLFFGK